MKVSVYFFCLISFLLFSCSSNKQKEKNDVRTDIDSSQTRSFNEIMDDKIRNDEEAQTVIKGIVDACRPTKADTIKAFSNLLEEAIIDANDLIAFSEDDEFAANKFIHKVRSSYFFSSGNENLGKSHDGVLFIRGRVDDIKELVHGCKITVYDSNSNSFGKLIFYTSFLDEGLYKIRKGDVLYFAAVPLCIDNGNIIFDVALSSLDFYTLIYQIFMIVDEVNVLLKNTEHSVFSDDFKKDLIRSVARFFYVEYKDRDFNINPIDCSYIWCKNWFGI